MDFSGLWSFTRFESFEADCLYRINPPAEQHNHIASCVSLLCNSEGNVTLQLVLDWRCMKEILKKMKVFLKKTTPKPVMCKMDLDCMDLNIFSAPQMSMVSYFFTSDANPLCSVTVSKTKFTLLHHGTELFRYLKSWNNSSSVDVWGVRTMAQGVAWL